MKPAQLGRWAAGLALAAGLRGAAPPGGFALEGNPVEAGQIDAAVRATGLKPEWIVFFLQWPEIAAEGGFPTATLRAIDRAGARAVLTWEPMYYRGQDGAETMIPAAAITGGDYDRYLDAFAREAAAWRRPIYLRLAHEMNLERYHWGGARSDYGPAAPERYRALWRHVVDRFRRAGASNVKWIFCPNCDSVPGPGTTGGADWNVVSAYYPGSDYVDVLGMDGYNWGDTQTPEKNGWRSSWRPFSDLFSGLHDQLRALAPDKPLCVFETASAPTGGDKAAWLDGMLATGGAWGLGGIVWFEIAKEVDWRLESGLSDPARRALARRWTGRR